MLHVKFENCRSSGFIEKCLNKLFSIVDERQTRHDAKHMPEALVWQ